MNIRYPIYEGVYRILTYISTVFGQVLKGTSAEYKGKKYPSFLFKKGRPVPEFRRYLQIEKLFIS